MLDQMICGGTHNATSLLGLQSGPMRFDSLAGQMIDLFGPVPVLANLSARQAKELGLMTSGTYGQPSITSSKSAGLQKSLESRLQARTRILGSTLYTLTWKPWVTPSGVSRSRLRASVRRTSETAITGWPTPKSCDSKGNPYVQAEGCRRSELRISAALAGWATPRANDGIGGPQIPKNRQGGMALKSQALLVKAMEPARLTDFGDLLTGSDAQMDSGGQLNPEHSRWLMGLPIVWASCAPSETPSMLNKQRNLSAPPYKKEAA